MSTITQTIAQFTNVFREQGRGGLTTPRTYRPARTPATTQQAFRSRAAPRVLILSASAGAGHVRAAEAIELALREEFPDAHVVNQDILRLTNAAFRHFYGRTYFDVVARAPHLVGYLYDRLDRPAKWKRLDRARARFQRLVHLRRVVDLIESHPWDVIINTHFLSAEVIASLKDAGRCDVPQVTVTTDFYVHHMWVKDHVERYYTATDEAAVNLAPRVPAGSVEVTGIPVHPAFAKPLDPAACRERQRLAHDRPVVLQLGGGLGLRPMEQVHREILSSRRPLHLVSVTGRNAVAREKLDRVPCPPHHRRTVLGFTSQMHELLAATDVVVSKPGGLTTSESLAIGTSMIVVDPIPGQETRNADYLLEHGAAVKVNALASLGFKLEGLLSDGDRLTRMRAAARRLGKPRAAFDVVRRAVALCCRE